MHPESLKSASQIKGKWASLFDEVPVQSLNNVQIGTLAYHTPRLICESAALDAGSGGVLQSRMEPSKLSGI
jgi:hypothetical protein